MTTAELFEMSVGLRALHARVKFVRGPKFEQDIAEVQPFLEQLAGAKNFSLYAAAITYANDCPSKMTRGIILAVAVELSLRDAKAKMESARS